jgi:hypothetical protein
MPASTAAAALPTGRTRHCGKAVLDGLPTVYDRPGTTRPGGSGALVEDVGLGAMRLWRTSRAQAARQALGVAEREAGIFPRDGEPHPPSYPPCRERVGGSRRRGSLRSPCTVRRSCERAPGARADAHGVRRACAMQGGAPVNTSIPRYTNDPVSARWLPDLWVSSHVPSDEVSNRHASSPPQRSRLSYSGDGRQLEARHRRPDTGTMTHRRRYPHFCHLIQHGIAHWKTIEPV